MKNVIMTALVLSITMVSCSDKKETEASQSATTSNTETTAAPAIDSAALAASNAQSTAAPQSSTTAQPEGLKLIEGADCLSCHKMDAKLVGPSYQDVAKKYTDADVDHLAQKVIDGGKGVWGEVPMTPHAGLTKDNAKLMVKYILSLKKS